MVSGNSIEVYDVVKKFRVYLDKGKTLKELALFSKRRKFQERQVLNGLTFKVKQGEAVGLIGHNGCGKSTTLKLLTRIMYPDSGTIKMKGRVSSLIELGAGFHPDMSGRENIYINASIFGLNRKEIEARLNQIIAFSELEEFIDNPVRTYSSGMYMRLAFSIAINVDADILLIDEILAVGDSNFQTKCFNKLMEVKKAGTTIVIVSHSLGQIEQICDKTIWIHDGVVRACGSPREIHPQYLDFMGKKRQEIISKEAEFEERPQEDKKIEKEKRWGNGEARIKNVYSIDSNGISKNVFKTEEGMTLVLEYAVNIPIKNAVFGIGFFREDGIQCYGTNTKIERMDNLSLIEDGTLKVVFPHLDLLPGKYSIDIAIQKNQGEPLDYFKEAYGIEIFSDIDDVGVARLEHRWIFEEMS